MINNDMRWYDYYLLEDADGYGQPVCSEEVQGSIKMAVNIASQTIRDSVAYKGTELVGLTHAPITDKYIVLYENEKYKVLYVNPKGRMTQVFMTRM